MPDQQDFDPHDLTFSQRQGIDPLPERLALGVLPHKSRLYLWDVVHKAFQIYTTVPRRAVYAHVMPSPFLDLLKLAHREFYESPIDEFTDRHDKLAYQYKVTLFDEPYNKVLNLLQCLLRYANNDGLRKNLAKGIDGALRRSYSAYIVADIDGKYPTIMPAVTEQEGQAILGALQGLAERGMAGARTHLLDAGTKINAGDWAGSVRDSIHAVESVAVTLDEGASQTLGPALNALEEKGHLHGALKKAFSALYGYASNEEGIRHSLVFQDEADVDDADAVFMLGACASFVSYLLAKGQ